MATAPADANEAAIRYDREIRPMLEDLCYRCHGDGSNKGNVALDAFPTPAEAVQDKELWHRVLKNTRAGLMPPHDKPQLYPDELALLSKWIKYDVIGVDPERPDPGRLTVRRLNRVEYRNTIRDLMGIDFNSEVEFPPDDTGHGFDNIADVLTLSPLLLEKYLQAAETIVGAAVPKTTFVIREQEILPGGSRDSDKDKAGERIDFYEPMTLTRDFSAPHPGTYRLLIEYQVRGSFNFDPGAGKLDASIDDKPLFDQKLEWSSRRTLRHESTHVLGTGAHSLGFAWTPFVGKDKQLNPLRLEIRSATLQGPLEEEHWIHPPDYLRFFPDGPPPTDLAERRAYARKALERFLLRAHRRPPAGQTVDALTELAAREFEQDGKPFEVGVGRAMMAALASPRFLFRIEHDEDGHDSASFAPIDEFSLASRLSYFLWSTMPDDELLRLAGRRELRPNLDSQVARMLADPKAAAFARNFVGQWLQTRDVELVPINSRVVLDVPRPQKFTDPFDGDLRRLMRAETEMAFGHIVREDRSVLELIDADYTFLNEALAEFYGIEGVAGEAMRLVRMPAGSPRGGVLTHGSFLTVTSNPTRTSPVKRGLFVLENILGTPPPPPPANVPDLEESTPGSGDREPTLREMLALHREQPLCHSCHNRMDPLGLALENFDALGKWRDLENDQPIETTGELITGEAFSNIDELKRILATGRRLDFYRCLTEKLLTYAIGRGPEIGDIETVDRIVDELDAAGGSFSALLQGVIKSAPFQLQRRTPAAASLAKSSTSHP